MCWVLQGRVVRIAFSTVRGEVGQEHHEITGRMPALNDALQNALVVGRVQSDRLMSEVRASLQVLAGFWAMQLDQVA